MGTVDARQHSPKAHVAVQCEGARADFQAALDERSARSDGRQSAARTASTAHLASCADCRGEAALLRELDRLLASEPVAEPPADFAASVLALVGEEARRARRRARFAGVALAAAVAAVVLGLRLDGLDLAAGGASLAGDVQDFALGARDQGEALASSARIALGESGLTSVALPSIAALSMPLALSLAGVLALAQLGWFRARRRVSEIARAKPDEVGRAERDHGGAVA